MFSFLFDSVVTINYLLSMLAHNQQ